MNNKGFTLIEVIVTSFFLVLMTTAVVTSALKMRSVYQAADSMAELQYDSRLALNGITKDLRSTTRSQVVITPDYPERGFDRIRYELPLDWDNDGVPDLFYDYIFWDPRYWTVEVLIGDDGVGRLVRYKYDQPAEILAENVSSVSFAGRSQDLTLYPNEIRVVLELAKQEADGRTTSLRTTTTVNMRL